MDLPALPLGLTRCPRPFDAARGQDARAALPWATGDLGRLVAGAAGCSPYLAGLLAREGAWLETAMSDPGGALAAQSTALAATPATELGDALRQGKRRVALLSALADLGGVWDLMTVTQTLTAYADLATQLAFRAAVAAEITRGKLPGATPDDAETAGGLVAFAMGKMGAEELNYSSDIDLIVLFDETRFDPADFHDARASLIRATRKAAAVLNDVTAEGYVFRTDLRLRPDPAVTPVCLAMEAAERYYESLGRTWERAAWIKARPCAGDIAAGQRFQDTLRPFVWRRHLDFAAIDDAHNMRLAIRSHKGLGGPITLPGHNMKLGRGGIREIEFFCQTRQLIAGGRDPDLRARGTLAGLGRLAAKGWIQGDTARILSDHYTAHRTVEHRLQMVGDAQTHDLPGAEDGFDRLAAMMDTDTATLKADLTRRLEEVHALAEHFFAGTADAASQGAAPPPVARPEIVDRWRSYPALRSDRAVDIFDRLQPEILRRLNDAARPEEALLAFDGFLAGLPAGVQVFALFEANPHLIDLLLDIVGTAPDLGQYLARNAAVFDAVIGGGFFSPWPGRAALQGQLADVMAREDDYERRLDAARRWAREWHFRIGVHLLRGLATAREAGRHYADLAEAALAAVWPEVQAQFATRHGPPPGRGAVIVGMGSLGAGRLHAQSDLDVIVVYDAVGADMSDGPRPLAVQPYYARLTQALITAVSAQMAEGRLYEIDMRLRPSGNKGPVATALTAFRSYQQDEAWVWEHLALTRARVIAGPDDLAADVEAVRADVLSRPRDAAQVLAEVAAMRARIAAAKGDAQGLEAKLGQGRLQDIELLGQAGALLAGDARRGIAEGLSAGARQGWLSGPEAEALTAAYLRFLAFQTGARLLSAGALDVAALGAGGQAFLRRLTGCADTSALVPYLDAQAATAAAIIDTVLGKDAPDAER